jgi:hypothetical protein
MRMSPFLSVLTGVWGAETAVLVGLLIYRALLGLREDDRLFLGAGEAHQEREQHDLQNRIVHLNKYAMMLGILSGVLLLAALGMFAYEQVNRPPL